MADVPTITLPGGQKMPVIGFGTWSVWKDSAEDVYKSVKCALESGYRHIDCAYAYNNEEAVGKALKEKLDDGSLKREDLFVTTKVWCTYHGKERPLVALRKSLEWLGLDYVDLYLIHWPHAFQAGEVDFPVHPDGKTIFDTTICLEDTWKGMELCYDEGLAKNLGISNFNKAQTDRMLKVGRIKPCNLQVELHIYHSNPALREHCAANGITVTAYAPLGAPNRPWANKADPKLLEDPALKKIATAKNKTVAQVALRYLLQLGVVVIPKSVTPKRIVENFQVFDFTLTDDEMEQLKAANKDFRAYTFEIGLEEAEYPFHVTY